MIVTQLVLSSTILFILLRTWQNYRQHKFSYPFFLLWSSLWLVILSAILHPSLLSQLAHRLGISRGVDLGIYLSIIFLFYLVYRLLLKIKHLETQITILARKQALKKPYHTTPSLK